MSHDLVPASNQKQRDEIYKAMTPACQEMALEVERLDLQVRKGVAIVAYDVGVLVNRALSDDLKYGANGVAQIAAYMNYPGGADALNRHRNLVAAFPRRDDFLKMLAKKRVDGRPLEHGHMATVAKLEDPETRRELLEVARNENLSVNQFEELVKAKFDRKVKRNSTGRKPQIPKTPHARFQKGYADSLKLFNYLEAMAAPTFGELQELPADKVDDKLIGKLEEFEAQLVKTHDGINAVLEGLVPAKEYLLKCQAGEIDEAVEDDVIEEETVPVKPPAKKPAPKPPAAKKPALAKPAAAKAAAPAPAKPAAAKTAPAKGAKRRRPAPV